MAAPHSNPIGWLNEYSTRNLSGAKLEDEYNSDGPAHNKSFVCNIKLSHLRGRGEGKTKKEAKLNAALTIVNSLLGTQTEISPSPKVSSKGSNNDATNKSGLSGNAKGSLQELCQKNGYGLPEYNIVKQDGPDHNLQFTSKCVVKDKNGEVLHQSFGSGPGKKSAETEAAILMQKEILNILEHGQPNPHVSSRSGQEAGISMEQDNQSDNNVDLSSNAKGTLQEICQKNMLLIPEYKLVDKKGPSHDLHFTVLCTVKDSNKDVLKKVYGNGASKRLAECDAAMKMKGEIERMLPQEGKLRANTVSHRGLEEGDIVPIDELYANVMNYSFHMPELLIQQSEPIDSGDMSTMKYLCLALAHHTDPTQVVSPSYDLTSYPIASQGIGVTENEAKTEALLNLINNIQVLLS